MEKMHTPEPWEIRTYIDRFWSRVNVAGDNDCWEWTRGTTSDGYGVFHFGNSSIRAHRFSYQQSNGRITEHECVLHSCDNPRCVNPKHLWIGTRAENNADKESKKRGIHPVQGVGESNTNSVLTTPEVIAARVMNRKGLPQARIAKLLGVSTATVCMIMSGERRAEETERRVSACVNACAGLPTEMLEEGGIPSIAQHMKLEKQRNELQEEVNALKERAEYDLAEFARTLDISYDEIKLLKKQRDELLAAMERIKELPAKHPKDPIACANQAHLIAELSISSVKGGAA